MRLFPSLFFVIGFAVACEGDAEPGDGDTGTVRGIVRGGGATADCAIVSEDCDLEGPEGGCEYSCINDSTCSAS